MIRVCTKKANIACFTFCATYGWSLLFFLGKSSNILIWFYFFWGSFQALKIQYLRLIHNFCDRDSCNQANKDLLLLPAPFKVRWFSPTLFLPPWVVLERTLTPSCHLAIQCISLSTACSTMLIHRWLDMTYNFMSMGALLIFLGLGWGAGEQLVIQTNRRHEGWRPNVQNTQNSYQWAGGLSLPVCHSQFMFCIFTFPSFAKICFQWLL